ncbi:hypothetical protein [Streptomyces sp. NPDC091209]|uniref:hypothetical protein n=1 Tax=Streptomyces sp. NPDC091209 TaxID=3365974 RepID=UPI0037F8251A
MTQEEGNSVIRQRTVLAAAAGLATALLLTACGAADQASGTDPGSTAPAATAAPDPAASAPAASPTTGGGTSGSGTSGSGTSGSGTSGSGHPATATLLTVRVIKGTGSIVTDGRGMTLYRYDKDRPDPSRWTCAGPCTKTWLPVIVQDGVQARGVEKSLLGTVHRDGMPQLTLGGWPLYRYAGDTGAGQVNGQGKDGQWYAVSPSGQKSALSG